MNYCNCCGEAVEAGRIICMKCISHGGSIERKCALHPKREIYTPEKYLVTPYSVCVICQKPMKPGKTMTFYPSLWGEVAKVVVVDNDKDFTGYHPVGRCCKCKVKEILRGRLS